jgi:hypothetical protein
VRGSDYFRGTVGNDLKGDQVDAFAGLTRRAGLYADYYFSKDDAQIAGLTKLLQGFSARATGGVAADSKNCGVDVTPPEIHKRTHP